jgi:hypothetical protein
MTELLLAGRIEEAMAHLDAVAPHGASVVTDAVGILSAFALLLAGRTAEAATRAERAVGAARSLEARPAEIAALALLAEINGDPTGLPAPPVVASSVAESLLLRAHVALGNAEAREPLERAARSLVAPGLLIGL